MDLRLTYDPDSFPARGTCARGRFSWRHRLSPMCFWYCCILFQMITQWYMLLISSVSFTHVSPFIPLQPSGLGGPWIVHISLHLLRCRYHVTWSSTLFYNLAPLRAYSRSIGRPPRRQFHAEVSPLTSVSQFLQLRLHSSNWNTIFSIDAHIVLKDYWWCLN